MESAIGAHLLNQCLEHRLQLNYWRECQDEVDFVLTGHGKAVGIEVRSSVPKITSGMSAFMSRFQPDQVLLVGPSGLPAEEFLLMDMNLWLDQR